MEGDYQTLGQVIGFIGCNTDMIEELLPKPDEPYFIWNCDNVLIKNGKIGKLKGTDYLNDVSTQLGIADYRTILGIPIYRQYDQDKFLMAITPQRLYELVGDTTWTPRGTIAGGDNDSVATHANIEDKFVFVVSDSSIVYEWFGATFQAVTFTAEGITTLKARHLLEFKTHLILLRTIEDDVEQYQTFWASDPGDYNGFSQANRLLLDTEGVIKGGKRLEDVIMVYMDKAIHYVTWDESYGYTEHPFVDGIGLYAPKTLCGNKDVHFFLSQEGLMKMVRGDIPRSVSERKFDKLILDEIDPVYYYRAVAYFYPHLKHLFLSYPKSGSNYNDTQIIYDVSAKELVSKKDLVAENYSAYDVFEKDLSGLSPDERKQYGLGFIPIIGNKDGYIKEQKINSYQDGVSNYESNIVLPPTFWKAPERNKRCLQADMLIEKLTDEDISFGIDFANEMNENFGPYSFTITGNGGKGTRRYELRSDDNDKSLDVFGKAFVVKIKDITNPYGFRLHGVIFRGYYSTIK